MQRNQLIVQLPLSEGTDFDRLLHVEETLMNAFTRGDIALVEGHEMGNHGFNIFISPRGDWAPAIAKVEEMLRLRGVLEHARIAKLPAGGDVYELLRPAGGGVFEP